MTSTRELIFESITVFKLPRSSTWRRGLDTKYPDPRNVRAAKVLEALADSQIDEVLPETWAALDPYIESPALQVAVSEAARDTGFRRHPENIDVFLRIVAEKLDARESVQ